MAESKKKGGVPIVLSTPSVNNLHAPLNALARRKWAWLRRRPAPSAGRSLFAREVSHTRYAGTYGLLSRITA
jgi:hypothetical protein